MAKRLEFHFKGGCTENHQLPVELMINLLSGMKDLAYLIIAQEHGIQFSERSKSSKQIKEDYSIKCELPQEGCYMQAISFDYTGNENMIQIAEKSFEKIEDSLRFTADADEPKIIHAFPDVKIRSKALRFIKQSFPQLNSDIHVEVTSKKTSINSRVMQKNITSIIDKTQSIVEEYMTVVTGYLTSIDFAKKKMTIIYPVTGRSLDCFYNEEVESMLFDNRRQLVQITGMVVLDENDNPKEITDATSIQDIS